MPNQPHPLARSLGDRDRRRVRRYSYLICAVIFLSYLLVFFHRVCPSVLALEMQAAFGVGGTLLGVLGSAYFYPYGLMQFPVGLLADSWGPRKTVSLFLVVAAAGSVLMGLSPGLGWAVAGSVVIETVFSWPGLGLLMVEAVQRSDYPVVQACFLLIAVLTISGNFVADLLYGLLDPRIVYS